MPEETAEAGSETSAKAASETGSTVSSTPQKGADLPGSAIGAVRSCSGIQRTGTHATRGNARAGVCPGFEPSTWLP
jgi:hypothetical protein